MLNRISILTLIVVGTVALVTSSTANAQTTWHVDDDAPNDPGPGDPTVSDPLEDGSPDHPFDAIQEGIDAASNGDTVLVADGTYTGTGNKNLDFDGKAITVRSENGPDTCIIDCQGVGRGFYFHGSEGADAVVDGFAVANGSTGEGGAICCYQSSPTIANCTITNSTAPNGGGISGRRGSPTISNCTISGNVANNGGGIFCCESSPTITDCTISGNAAEIAAGGGGIWCFESTPMIISCAVTENVAEDGGGIWCQSSNVTIRNSTISENSATGISGGGVFCDYGSSVALSNCVISNNSVTIYGGGICCWSSTAEVVNCTIAGNVAGLNGGGVYCHSSITTLNNCAIEVNGASRGGGVYCDNTNPTMVNCIVTSNSADLGGGIRCYDSSDPTVTNCILWQNVPQQLLIDVDDPAVTYCAVDGGWPGGGNIDADPLFVDPDGPDDDPNTWEDNDYRLSAGSPCIDAGDNTAVPLDTLDLDDDGDTDERIPFDLDGNPRFVQDPFTEDTGVPDPPYYRYVVDMGAYEYQFCFGDLDDDNDIDLADLAQLLGSYGETAGVTYYDGDLDGDGDVDLADLAELLGAYGTVCE